MERMAEEFPDQVAKFWNIAMGCDPKQIHEQTYCVHHADFTWKKKAIPADKKTKMGSLGKAAYAVALRAAADGIIWLSAAKKKKRYDICKECPGKHYIKDRDQCSQCGCNMKIKTSLAALDCPEGYW
jgi:hypothetical protein